MRNIETKLYIYTTVYGTYNLSYVHVQNYMYIHAIIFYILIGVEIAINESSVSFKS